MSSIVPHVYLGDEEDAKRFRGPKVAVHENVGTVSPESHWIPVLEPYDWKNADARIVANRRMLNAATDVIRFYQSRGRDVLVHCAAGVERSPLVLAWYLRRFGYAKTIPEAYAIIRAERPIVQERTHWLPPHSGP